MTKPMADLPITGGGVLALLLQDYLHGIYGKTIPVDDVFVGFSTMMLELLSQMPPMVAEAYRQFVVSALASEETRQ